MHNSGGAFFAFADNRSADLCFRLKGKLKWGMRIQRNTKSGFRLNFFRLQRVNAILRFTPRTLCPAAGRQV